jgi:hypothetical protein
MEKDIMANSKMVKGTVRANKFGRIILYMKGIGVTIKQMVEVELSLLMGTSTKDNLKMIKLKVMDLITIQTVQVM